MSSGVAQILCTDKTNHILIIMALYIAVTLIGTAGVVCGGPPSEKDETYTGL